VTYVPAAMRREVIKRAGNRCEYCQLPTEVAFYPHEVDHVIAEKHGGATDIDNLAFSCWRCNRHKGSDLTSFDPETGRLITFSTRGHKSGLSTSLLKRKG
jgi:5-methylcytosine-specific restriction endonuclease McrA